MKTLSESSRADWSRAMVYESIDQGNDVTSRILSLVFRKNNLLLNMDKEEPNFNIWTDVSDSELVTEAAKVEQKYEQQ